MNFFIFVNPMNTNIEGVTDFLRGDSINTGRLPNALKCDVCGKLLGSLSWLPPYTAELEFWGREVGDVAFGTAEGFLISERFKESYEQTDLKGLSGFEKVEIVKMKRHKRKHPELIPNYYYVRVPITKAKIDFEASELEYEGDPVCPGCNSGKRGITKRVQRVILENDSWSGEDIFIARGLWGTFLTTERFRDFYLSNNFKNGVFIEAENYHFDFYPWEKGKKLFSE
ncbi:MAG: hypothetical protein AB1454_14555 [Candidatus Auribacterota bacterium]